MKPAANIMEDKINNIEFKDPVYKIINNVTAKAETSSKEIKIIDRTNFSTVKWRESIIKMSSDGVRNFIEIGPGKVLTGMVKRTAQGANCFSINSIC